MRISALCAHACIFWEKSRVLDACLLLHFYPWLSWITKHAATALLMALSRTGSESAAKLEETFLYTLLTARVMDCVEWKLPLAYCPQRASCKTSQLLVDNVSFERALIWCAVSCLHELCHVHICRSSGLVHSKACNPRRSWEEEVNLAQDSVEVNCGGHFMTFYPERSSPKRSQGIVQGYLLTSCTAYSDILESADCAAY